MMARGLRGEKERSLYTRREVHTHTLAEGKRCSQALARVKIIFYEKIKLQKQIKEYNTYYTVYHYLHSSSSKVQNIHQKDSYKKRSKQVIIQTFLYNEL